MSTLKQSLQTHIRIGLQGGLCVYQYALIVLNCKRKQSWMNLSARQMIAIEQLRTQMMEGTAEIIFHLVWHIVGTQCAITREECHRLDVSGQDKTNIERA